MGGGQSTGQPLGEVKGHDNIKKDIEDIIKNNYVEEAKEKITELLGKWKTIPVNVGLIGERGAGKSSFINNMMGTKVGGKLAKVGVSETTRDATKYPHPDNEKLCFWDLPGFGGKLYLTIEKYLRAMDISRFDLILLLFRGSFKPIDANLCKIIKNAHKPLFIVRTHFDIDTQDVVDENYDDVKKDILLEITSYQLPVVKATTKNISNDQYKCYFLSNRSHGFDYQLLMNDLVAGLESSDKRDALTFSLGNRNRAILRLKKERLERRILAAATAAAASGAIPIPGLDAAISISIITEEIISMARILGIMKFLQTNTTLECVRECNKYLATTGVINLMKSISVVSAVMIADDALKFIPIFGTIIGGIISSATNFVLAKLTLTRVLNAFLVVAEKAIEEEEKLATNGNF